MSENLEHVTVYHQPGSYAGWPANQGMWSWDNELLVGFVLGRHAKDRADWKYGHPIDQAAGQEHVYARSLDGGGTWARRSLGTNKWIAPESGKFHGRTGFANDHTVGGPVPPRDLHSPMDFSSPGFALSFARVTNHVGPTHFYYSCNRGNWWAGPYLFPDLGTPGVAARTDYVVLGKRELLAMLTVAKENGREGRVLCARTGDGGMTWKIAGLVSEPADVGSKGFSIMPSTVDLGDGKLLSVVRRCRQDNRGRSVHWLEAYFSYDSGTNWYLEACPVSSTGHGGSPPALLKLADGRLMLAYVIRGRPNEPSRLCAKMSDNGWTWAPEVVLRDDGVGWDLGYPRAVQRPDGCVVVTYYWVDRERYPDRWIGATIWRP